MATYTRKTPSSSPPHPLGKLSLSLQDSAETSPLLADFSAHKQLDTHPSLLVCEADAVFTELPGAKFGGSYVNSQSPSLPSNQALIQALVPASGLKKLTVQWGKHGQTESTVVNVLIRMLDPSHWVVWDWLYK